MTRFAFLADPQLGCRATFSGLSDAAIASLRHRDIHVRAMPPTDGHEWEMSQLHKAVEAVNAAAPDFVVIGGDMIDDARNASQHTSLLEALDSLDPAVPIRWVPGNHDCAFDGQQPTRQSLSHYTELFGPDTYAFQVDEASFVVLNTTVFHRPERVPEQCEAQLAFLQAELELSAQRPGATILLGHHPLFVEYPTEPDSYWNIPLHTRRIVLDAVETFEVAAMFAGHYHRNAIAHAGPFQMVTSGPVGFPLGDDPSGIRIVDVAAERITHDYIPID